MPMAEELQKHLSGALFRPARADQSEQEPKQSIQTESEQRCCSSGQIVWTLKHKHLLMNTSKQKNEPEIKQNMGSLNVMERFFRVNLCFTPTHLSHCDLR